jgi:hypothetical protein
MFEMTPSVIDARSHQHVRILSNRFKWPHKKSQGFRSGERAGDKTGPIEEAIDNMQFDVVDVLILSVEHVEDDTDVNCSCSVLQIVKLETSIRNASRRQLTFGSSSTGQDRTNSTIIP